MISLDNISYDILNLVYICFGLCLLQRLVLSFLVRDSFDTYGHLYFAKLVRQQNAGPFGSIETNALGSSSYKQPFLWHWAMTLFGVKYLNLLKKVINPLLDSIFSGFIVYSAYISGLNEIESFMCGLVYVITPIWYSVLSIGPRVSSLTPRLTSEIFFCMSLMFVFCPYDIDNNLSIILSSVCFTIVILASKFGVQVVLFVVPIVLCTTLSIELLVSVVASLFMCLFLSKGRIFGTFKRQINHLKWYYHSNKNSNTPVSSRNSIKQLINKMKGKSLTDKLKLSFFFMIRENSYVSTCLKIPFICYVIYSIFKFNNLFRDNFDYIVVSAIIVFLIINFRNLLFLGEAERYINHVSFFVVFVFLKSVKEMHNLFELVLLYSVFYFLIEIIYLYCLRKKTIHREEIDLKVINDIQVSAGDYKILCYPFHAVGAYRILYNTDSRVLFPLNNHTFFNEELGMKYPYLNLTKLFKTELGKRINYVIIDVKKTQTYKDVNDNIFKDWKLLKHGGPFYRIFSKK